MTTDTQSDVLTKDVIAEAADLAYAAEGYVKDDERDYVALTDAIYRKVSQARVNDLGERESKAITRGDLVAAVFSSLPGPGSFDEQENPDLAEAVYLTVEAKVWDLASPFHNGKVQQRVGERPDPLVLCRTVVGTDRVPAVYVTAALKCIRKDLGEYLAAQQRRIQRKAALNLAMVVRRLPEFGAALGRDYERESKAAIDAGRADLKPALEEAKEEDGGE